MASALGGTLSGVIDEPPGGKPVAADGGAVERVSTADRSMSRLQRSAAALVGFMTAGAGITAVFLTDNELGSAALLVVGGAFIAMATFQLIPTRFRMGDNEMQVGQAALKTLSRVVREGDAIAQEQVIDAFEEELAARGVSRPPADAVDAVLDRFERYSGSSNCRTLHDDLRATGWKPIPAPRGTYIRWLYEGGHHTVRLFQNSAKLISAAAQQKAVVADLPGAIRSPAGEFGFVYSDSTEKAVAAAATLKRFADAD